jgi:hypothetical protein
MKLTIPLNIDGRVRSRDEKGWPFEAFGIESVVPGNDEPPPVELPDGRRVPLWMES